jgi:hypothetical protein
VSVTAPPPSSATGTPGTAPTGAVEPLREACPLCGAPLHPEQEWCLNCGAAARTRLAASPGWRGPIVALVVLLVLSLGVLAGSLVKLAGGSPPAATQTTTVTTAAATTIPPTGLLPGTTTTPTTPTAPLTHTQPGLRTPTTRSTPTTTPTAPTAPAGKTKAKGPLGGIKLKHLKPSVAERLRELGLAGK